MRGSHNTRTIQAAPNIGAACLLCALLAFGVLWPVPLSFASSDPAATESQKNPGESEKAAGAPSSDATTPEPLDNVVVAPPLVEPVEPAPLSDPALPAAPAHDRAWSIGKDEPDAVVAELWDDGTFVIDGDGAAVGFDAVEEVPWLAEGCADDIERVIFADKVDAESMAHWFEGCANLAEIANIPKGVKDMTRAFFACPKLVELPDEFEIAEGAKTGECFGLDDTAHGTEALLTTAYRGTNGNVLAYAWELDGRELVNPDAPSSPAVDDAGGAESPKASEKLEVPETPEPSEALETPEVPEIPDGDGSLGDELPLEEGEDAADAAEPVDDAKPVDGSTDPAEPAVDAAESDPSLVSSQPEDIQVNITVPSSVSMMLGAEGDNTAVIPVLAANRSERSVAIVGARLKRAGQDLPGGSWSLSTEDGSATFVQNARFTPLGLEATFDRPVVLASGNEDVRLVWHGSFTDRGMRRLADAVADAGDGGFAYGSMIWIVSAAA